MGSNGNVLLQVHALKKYFPVAHRKVLKAVDGISFAVRKGETLGLVGESGCGKSTAGRTIIRLYDPTGGRIIFDGHDISGKLSRNVKKDLRRRMQMIFQDPYASLNPRMMVKDIIAEGLDIHHLVHSNKERMDKVYEMLAMVGLNKEHANRYPHEFSGGQRQRIGIARALALDPDFIIADEPISALDVSIQAQVVNLLQSLQEKQGLTYLFIAHDLSMVKHISDRVGVMYLGNMAELASSDEVYNHPLHPYTQSLLSAIPIADPKVERTRERIILKGEVPSPIDPPSGCRFRTRCPFAMAICAKVKPKWHEVEQGHWVACHLHDEETKKATGEK
ncbi:MAG: dipeptide ABC transporter ATP-binding protein [Sporolactobacillus sp.]|jgi:oligopeptide/dipeptide ABC transporter ATP-binding protein|nr:dipeptide ABC transporter ATP-binding protein [Sporolactobacillus sp.]